jgi:hypothetical protein
LRTQYAEERVQEVQGQFRLRARYHGRVRIACKPCEVAPTTGTTKKNWVQASRSQSEPFGSNSIQMYDMQTAEQVQDLQWRRRAYLRRRSKCKPCGSLYEYGGE